MRASKCNTPHRTILANRYAIISKLDSSKSSEIYTVFDEKTGEIKVAKIYENNFPRTFKKETIIFKKLQKLDLSTNIKFYESSIGDFTQNGHTTKKMYIILEYGSKGCLFDALNKTKKGFTEDVCQYILLNILNAVEALHKNFICHRDLKIENIVLVGNNRDIKLIDFGYATKFVDENNQPKKLAKFVGTAYCCAPEILEGKPYDGVKADIFSIGATLFTLMTKRYGFKEARINNISLEPENLLYTKIKEKKYEEYWKLIKDIKGIDNLSEKFKNLFLKMVAYNPDERLTIEQIRKDEFMAEIVNASEEYIDFLRQKMINEIEFSQN